MKNAEELSQIVLDRWNANQQVIWLVGDEPYQYQTSIEKAVARLKKENNEKVVIYNHDKINGFYLNVPGILTPRNKSNLPLIGLQMSVASTSTMTSVLDSITGLQSADKTIPFDPRNDIIFIFKDMDTAFNQDPMIVQFIRNIIQANMCSSDYSKITGGQRGRRMMIFITPTDKKPPILPEIDPIFMSLPGEETMATLITDTLERLKESNPDITKDLAVRRPILAKAMQGLSYQKAEDTLSLALAIHKNIDNLDAVLDTVEEQKSIAIAGIPGLTYIPKKVIQDIELPGYEIAERFIDDRLNLDPAIAKQHKIQRLKGISLGGRPGGGKTRFGMKVAKIAKRMLLIWSLGESQGGLVGQSEAQARRVIAAAQAMEACVLIDDIDKAGTNVAQSGYSGDGGTFGRMIQMLLTEMSSPENRAIWIFTYNRVQNIPGELMRPGRIDERFVVDAPDEYTRECILRVHANLRTMEIDNEDKLKELASVTRNWIGAELEDIINRGAIQALRKGTTKLPWSFMLERAAAYKPMADQAAYAEDIAKMEEATKDFIHIGNIPNTNRTQQPDSEHQKAAPARAGRSIR